MKQIPPPVSYSTVKNNHPSFLPKNRLLCVYWTYFYDSTHFSDLRNSGKSHFSCFAVLDLDNKLERAFRSNYDNKQSSLLYLLYDKYANN